LKSLAAVLLLILVISIILQNQTLMLTFILATGYLTVILVYVIRKVPKMPLEQSRTLVRALVGEKVKKTVAIRGKNGGKLHVFLNPLHQWVSFNPSRFTLESEIKVGIEFVPPLSGPSKIQSQALVIDQWGLTQTTQILEPVDLHIIPRARYAEWLARRYLENTAPGASPPLTITSLRAVRTTRRGFEHYGSRLYQPGDVFRDIDWKHTFKLHELVVKEFLGGRHQQVVITVNLAVKDAAEADALAYNLVMTALTFAREATPTGLAAYNNTEVLAVQPLTSPRETLKQALKLTRSITLINFPKKVLQPPNIRRLRRDLSQLEQAEMDSAKRLFEILRLEYEATKEYVEKNPAKSAIRQVVEATKPPLTMVMISKMNHDAEAVTTTLEELRQKGYDTIHIS